MLAVLYDVHGNLPALEAVIADARGRGADRFLLGGDYAAFGAWPVEAVAVCEALGEDATWIRGNWERWLGGDDADLPDSDVPQGARETALDLLDPAAVARLAALPGSAVVDGTLYCHASPGSDMRSFAPEASEDDGELVPAEGPARIVFGHTHVQFRREVERDGELLTLVNPGSVGLPLDGDPRAAYALVDDSGGLELLRVEYDRAASATALRRLGEPWAETIAGVVERGSFG